MLLDDVETYLNTFAPWQSGSVTFTVRKYHTADTPYETITLIEFPAGKSILAMGSSLRAPVKERAGLQVMVRGPQSDYAAARDVAEQVHLKLSFFNGTLSGRSYYIESMHAPTLLEQDRNNNWFISTNYLVMKDRG